MNKKGFPSESILPLSIKEHEEKEEELIRQGIPSRHNWLSIINNIRQRDTSMNSWQRLQSSNGWGGNIDNSQTIAWNRNLEQGKGI